MRLVFSKGDKKSFYKIISGICENLSAGWFGHILISPGFSFTFEIEKILVLIRSLLLAIIFMSLAIMFDKITKK